MKFEKLNENKIRITLNNQDLAEKHIDFHSFMSNSQESQNLFLHMLDEAEKKVGFITKDYKLRIEALAMSNGNFILTITRFGKNIDTEIKPLKNKNIKIKRKNYDITSKQLIYQFNSFDDFCNFSNCVNKLINLSSITKNTILYFYKNTYYLCFSNINFENKQIKQLHTLISEFGNNINNSEIFVKKLTEYGKIIFKNNAINSCIKYFNTL